MENDKDLEDNKPPVLGRWKNFYWLLITVLVILISIFYAITLYFK
tara:strand:+ start:47472 stop:47606 length:135 start_codon:yes stop_codon:yes gene_type:complete